MFRRLQTSLPQDIKVTGELEDLGYFVNDGDQIRMIRNPSQKYQYRINRSERVNDVHKEAINTCVRRIAHDRLTDLGLCILRLPLGAQINDSHIPIYVSRDLESRKRVVVVLGARDRELGILSHRIIGEEGIKIGSIQSLVEAITTRSPGSSEEDVPGIIVANPGQLIWYRGGGRALGYSEYYSLPRQSAVHEAFRIDPVKNRVPNNTTYAEHVRYIFETVIPKMTQPNAKFDIIGLEYTGDATVQFLAEHWDTWNNRINGICLGNPQFNHQQLVSPEKHDMEFLDFLAKRTRAYFVAEEPVETPLPGNDALGCNRYASGEHLYEEGILVRSWRSMLDWFNMIYVVDDYQEPHFTFVDDTDDHKVEDASNKSL